jgi:hypothetical protein
MRLKFSSSWATSSPPRDRDPLAQVAVGDRDRGRGQPLQPADQSPGREQAEGAAASPGEQQQPHGRAHAPSRCPIHRRCAQPWSLLLLVRYRVVPRDA